MSEAVEKAKNARIASLKMASASLEERDNALLKMAKALDEARGEILSENAKDFEKAQAEGLSQPLLARLKLGGSKIDGIIESLNSVAQLEDPLGKTLSCTELDKDLTLYKITVPIGVLAVVFESRPDVVVQVGSLCLKSGNAVLMKGGREASNTNRKIVEVMRKALEKTRIPVDAIQLVESRGEVADLLKLEEYISLVIPRGSNEFVKYVKENTNIPVLGHASGICHLYIHEKADEEMALALAVDAKTQYPAVCNAVETLLVDEKIASSILPKLKTALEKKGVKILGCEKTLKVIEAEKVREKDWATEYNDLILSIRVVSGMDEAVGHINTYGSGHTDAIVTKDGDAARKFLSRVDSSSCLLYTSPSPRDRTRSRMPSSA